MRESATMLWLRNVAAPEAAFCRYCPAFRLPSLFFVARVSLWLAEMRELKLSESCRGDMAAPSSQQGSALVCKGPRDANCG